MRVFVTGAAGFIGSSIVRHLHATGHTVSGSSHAIERLKGLGDLLEHGVELNFSIPTKPETFAGADAVVHCAYDNRPDKIRENIDGVTAMAAAAKKAGVGYQLFLSSHSARPDAPTRYGQLKFRLERYFLDSKHAVVRPGLVVGAGGLFLNQMRSVERMLVAVLPSPDAVPVYYIGIRDLVECIRIMLEQRMTGAYNLFHDPPASLREFFRDIKKIPVLPFPACLLIRTIRLAGSLFGELPEGIARIETMRQNMLEPIHESDLARFINTPRTLTEVIDETRSTLRYDRK